jgi:hypothetical protein
MPNAELVEDVRVVNRDIGDDEVSQQEQLEHVFAYVARLEYDSSGSPSNLGLVECRLNKSFLGKVEIDSTLGAKWTNDKRLRGSIPSAQEKRPNVGFLDQLASCFPDLG